MMIRYIPTLALAFFCLFQTAFSQIPQSIISKAPTGAQDAVLACPPGQQNFAGTVSLGSINAQSNDIDLDTMYLCLGDEAWILHNGDADLSGDPDPLTPPGIGYAFYDCLPTISGPDKTTIGTDPCLVDNPPPTDLFYVATAGDLNGDLMFFNDGNLISIFNGGAPALFWWAPITFDALVTVPVPPSDTVYQALYENNGPCVNANVDAAFATVYLNGISIANVTFGEGNTGCLGSFILGGGLPEWDGSNYSIDISLASDPSIKGFVTSGPATHGDQVSFAVPQPGLYTITVEDGKSCGATVQLDIVTCQAVVLEIGSSAGLPGDNVCVDISVENFVEILGTQFTLVYDQTILDLTSIEGFNPTLPGLGIGNFNALPGEILFSWSDFNPTGSTLSDGAVMFSLCFDIIGNLGDCSDVEFSNTPLAVEVITAVGLADAILLGGDICATDAIPVVTIISSPEACPGFMDGSFTVMVEGGTPAYEVFWQDLAGGPVQGPGVINTQGGSFTASNLSAGNYALTVTDSGSAPEYLDTVFIDEGPALNVIFEQVAPLCNGGTGSLTAVIVLDSVPVFNPGPQYLFVWSNSDTTQTISGITSGLYSVTVTDTITGCSAMSSTFLPQTPPIVTTVDVITDATCSGVADGSITVSASGGTPGGADPYTFFWPEVAGGTTETGATSSVSSLLEGVYLVEVIDLNGCVDSTLVTVGASKELVLTPLTTQDISCNALCDGSISVQASTIGGLSNSYAFNWVGVPGIPPPGPVNTATTSTVNNLCAGSYNVTLTDDAGCEVSASFSLVEPEALEASLLDFTNESCTVGSDGTATVGVTGGTYPYAYGWGVPGQIDSTIASLNANDYVVTVTDANGCQDSVSFTITLPTPPQVVALDSMFLNCFDDTDGVLSVVANPGSSPISNYAWSNGPPGPAQTSITGLAPGNYCVTITATDDCETIACADVIAPLPLQLDSTSTTSPLCPGLGGGAISVFVTGGTEPYFYDWSLDAFDGVGISAIGGANVIAGPYDVIITDANGCPALQVDVTIDDPPAIEVDFTGIDSVSCFANQGVPCDGIATAIAQYSDGSSGLFNFLWPSGESSFNAATSTAIQLCLGDQTLTVSDGTCSATFDVFIPFPDTLNVASLVINDVT